MRLSIKSDFNNLKASTFSNESNKDNLKIW